jgi:uncharacterized protein
MIIVLDTNVLVAGLLNPFGAPGRLLDAVLSGDLRLAYDDRILAEYRQVQARAGFGFDRAFIAELLTYLEAEGQHITAPPLNTDLPDPDDAPFLEVAQAAEADALVTGNIRHYPASARRGVAVLTPTEIVSQIADQKS